MAGNDDFTPNTELPFWPAQSIRRDEIIRAASLQRAAAFRAAFRALGAALRRAGAGLRAGAASLQGARGHNT
jgi:hypothetical protein